MAARAGVAGVDPPSSAIPLPPGPSRVRAREIDVQFLLGHSSPAMVRRYSATYNAEKAARAHAKWSPGDKLAGAASS